MNQCLLKGVAVVLSVSKCYQTQKNLLKLSVQTSKHMPQKHYSNQMNYLNYSNHHLQLCWPLSAVHDLYQSQDWLTHLAKDYLRQHYFDASVLPSSETH